MTALAAAGCREPPAAPYACECSYLTDMDDEGRLVERVCAPSAAQAAAIAKDCAARGAPAPVKACTCAPAPGAPAACHTGECLSPVRRD